MRHQDTRTPGHQDKHFCLSIRKLVTWCLCVLVTWSFAYALNIDKVKTHFLEGDYNSAILEGERILAKSDYSSHSDELYYILGLSYLKDGNYLRASDIFEIIIKEFKDSTFKDDAILGLGDAYFLKGDLQKAQGYYSELIDSNPQTKLKTTVYYRLSQVELKKGNLLQAKEYSDKLKQDFPFALETKLDEKAVISDFYYSVQVGSFANLNNAKNLCNKLIEKGYNAYIQEADLNKEKIYRVRVGKLKLRLEAAQLENNLSSEGYPTKIVP